MPTRIDILAVASHDSYLQEQLEPLYQRAHQVPGSVQYTIHRYRRLSQWQVEDTGMLVYHSQPNAPHENYLELRYCMSGTSLDGSDRVESLDLVSFRFMPLQLTQFVKPGSRLNGPLDDILLFRKKDSFSRLQPLCAKTTLVLERILNNPYTDTLENIFINAQTQMLLLLTMECMMGESVADTINCKFLANEADREKIIKAREILLQQIGEPITIKELSRKVAINECYLKKGFKEMFGTTVFEFYQGQRMEHAKFLLYEKGFSVTEVSVQLGYSSISHFSTAFKRHTGLKPCELLLRS